MERKHLDARSTDGGGSPTFASLDVGVFQLARVWGLPGEVVSPR